MQRTEPGFGRKRAVDATVGTERLLPRVVVFRCGGTEAGAALSCLKCFFFRFLVFPLAFGASAELNWRAVSVAPLQCHFLSEMCLIL